jgi:hypothetical protein
MTIMATVTAATAGVQAHTHHRRVTTRHRPCMSHRPPIMLRVRITRRTSIIRRDTTEANRHTSIFLLTDTVTNGISHITGAINDPG